MLGDAHVYANHVDALAEQVEREPRPFPTLSINLPTVALDGSDREAVVDAVVRAVEAVEYTDLELQGYAPHGKIAMQMSA